MGIAGKVRTLARIARRNPLEAWDLMLLRSERALGVSLHGLSRRRRMTRRFELANSEPVNGRLRAYGNYYLDPTALPDRPIVFSIGVGDDISFDRALLDRHDVRLFLFDPTPRSARFIAEAGLPPNVSFAPIAVADHDGTMTMFIDDLEPNIDTTTSVSVQRRGAEDEGLEFTCRRVPTLMKEQGVSDLDVLKLDIEGAAIGVLEDVLEAGIRPTQIAAEFERPERLPDVRAYLKALEQLFGKLRSLGYRVYRTRPDCKGFQVEVLAVREAGG